MLIANALHDDYEVDLHPLHLTATIENLWGASNSSAIPFSNMLSSQLATTSKLAYVAVASIPSLLVHC